jgi:branched-chain amino acid transport system substrate-binding protein
MQFRLLGALEVADDQEQTVRIVPGKESALLALLVIHARSALAVERIVDELWGEAAPQNARKQVQIHVSRLRKALGPERIVTTPAGYQLEAADDEIDVRRFEAAVRAGKPMDALAEWRSDALADFRYADFAQAEARRLEELREAVRADVIDEALQRGEAAAVIPELEAEIERNPLHERPRGQLMRALYLAGRQADALAAYRETRSTLEDELGIEPSPELRRLEQAILNHDPSLGTPKRPQAPVRRRRAGWLVLVGGVLLAGVAVALVLVLTPPARAPALPYVPDSLVRVNAGTGRVDATVPIAGAPGAVALDGGRVWVGSSAGVISAVNQASLEPDSTVKLPQRADELIASGSHIWAVSGNELVEVDPSYNTTRERIALPAQARIAPAPGGGLWAVDGSRNLRRYDENGHREKTVVAPIPLSDIASSDRKLWALSTDKATLLELRATTGRMLGRIPLELRPGYAAPAPLAVAAGDGAVWVLDGGPPSVVRIDPRIGAVTNTIPLGIGSNPVALTVGAGAVWVADSGDGTLARIDPSTLVKRRIDVGGSPTDVVAAPDSHVWATVQAGLDDNTGGVPSPLAVGAGNVLPDNLCSPVYGNGKPDVLLAADLPLQGNGANALTLQLSNAIRFVLAEHRFRAGGYKVGYQLCDDSSAQTGSWTPATCTATARAISRLSRVVAVIGPFNSGCAATELPILARSSNAPVAELSPSATYPGLTHPGPGTAANEPAIYRAHGVPIFLRDVADDAAQGAANAALARRLGVHRLVILEDGSSYGRGLAAAAAQTAKRLGISVAGTFLYKSGPTFAPLAHSVAARHPDGVFVAGLIDEGGNTLIQQLRNALGANAHILLPDGFTPFPVLLKTGPAAEGATITVAVPALTRLPVAGRRFVQRFSRAIGTQPEPYAVSAAAAAETMLAAIARSDGTRTSVRRALFSQQIKNGILGSFRFDANGDTTRGIVSVYEVRGGRVSLLTTVTPLRTSHI